MPVLAVVTRYAQIVEDLLALDDDIAQGAGDPVLAQTVSMLGLVSEMKEEASQQRAILAAALVQGAFGPGELAALQNAVSAQQTNLQAFDDSASANQLQLWNADVAASFGNQASADELVAISLATKAGGSGSLSSDPTTADDWYSTMTNTIEYQMGAVQQQLVASVTSRAAALRRNAITDSGGDRRRRAAHPHARGPVHDSGRPVHGAAAAQAADWCPRGGRAAAAGDGPPDGRDRR